VLRSRWQQYLGTLGIDMTYRPDLTVVDEDRTGEVVRQLVEYEIEPGLRTQAYLLLPLKLERPGPGIVVFHSTVNHSILQPAGLGQDLEKAFGWKLAQRGCVTFCPRNFLWPDNQHIAANEETARFQQRHPGVTGMAKMLYDAIVATNILAAQQGVDGQRLGAVGHSLGAKEVLYLAAFDERIKATVSSEGGIGTRFSNWDAPWYLGPAIKEPGFTREHHELIALVAPRAFLLIGGESADGDKGWQYIDAALGVYRLHDGTPRVGQYNHRRGHAVPPECEQRIYEWLETYL
jgi:dienelactone hydrolase